ncbi:hypothetical protein NHX12_024536 [Muraenolepis orangiensis]|uniref:Uncharacterized protein n=1 Tax=Muraenolepis orangiensis TaxID=630683 RepID=A0A9Q0EHK4_9TELE|nr:hypothetical protein NHX12_024536 [Muraenolepis orangiensis]
MIDDTPKGKGGLAAGSTSFNPSSGAFPSLDLANWNPGAFSQSNGDYSPMDVFYPQSEGSQYLQPQSESYDLQEPPQGVSEPYPSTFIVQSGGGYRRSRLSATRDRYSLNQDPEEFGVDPEDFSNDELPNSNKG